MDIFEKCYAPSLATDLQEKGVWGKTGRMGQDLRKFCSLFIIN